MDYVELRISSLFLTIRAGEKGSEGKKADGDLATSHYTKKMTKVPACMCLGGHFDIVALEVL